MADNDLTIQREVQLMGEEFDRLSKSSRESSKELREVNKHLRDAPESAALLAEKTKILNDQLQNAKDRSAALSSEIQLLNTERAKQAYTEEEIANRTAELNKQLASTNREIEGLTGKTQAHTRAQEEAAQKAAQLAFESSEAGKALAQQAEETKKVEDSTKSFSQSMTEFQSNLRAAQQVMRGLQTGFELLGGDPDSAMGKVLQQGQKVTQMITGLASAGKLLQNANVLTAGSFGNLALAAAAAYGAFTLVDGLLGKLDGNTRKIAGAISVLTGVVIAGAVAWMAYNEIISWGTAALVILPAIATSIAGVKALVSDVNNATADLAGISGISATSISTPSVLTYSGGGGATSTPSVAVQTLSQRQIEDATYAAVTRVVLEQGLNEPMIVDRTTLTQRDIRRWIFSGILNTDGTINTREVL